MRRALPFVLVLALLNGGCAMTQENVNIGYHPTEAQVQGAPGRAEHEVYVGVIADKRALEDPKIVFHKKNMYNETTSGSYMAEKPVADILQDALRDLYGQQPGASPDQFRYEMTGDLLDFEYDVVMGFWSSKINSKLTVQLRLKDHASGVVVWNETFMAHGHVDHVTSGSDDVIRSILTTAIDELIAQVRASEALQAKLESH